MPDNGTTINLPILQAGSQRISDSRLVSIIAFSPLPYLIFHHTLDFVAHGFLAGRVYHIQDAKPIQLSRWVVSDKNYQFPALSAVLPGSLLPSHSNVLHPHE